MSEKLIYELTYTYGEGGIEFKQTFLTKSNLNAYIEMGKVRNLIVISIDKVKNTRPQKTIDTIDTVKVSNGINKIIGYCRVSTVKQLDGNSLEVQKTEILNRYPTALIKEEQFSAKTSNRPILSGVLSVLIKGDTLVVSKLDRLARNTVEGIKIVEDLFGKGVAVHVLNIGLLENTSMGKFFLTTLLAVAEMERNTIIERTQTGKAIAKTKEGYREGRPKTYTKKQLDNALNMLSINGGSCSYTEVTEITNISKSTLIRENNKRKVCVK